MLCADSLSTCEPWEAAWGAFLSLKVSCLPTCLAKIGCSVVRVTGTEHGCDGEYRLDPAASSSFPKYKLARGGRTLGFSGTWDIYDDNGHTYYHETLGETNTNISSKCHKPSLVFSPHQTDSASACGDHFCISWLAQPCFLFLSSQDHWLQRLQ